MRINYYPDSIRVKKGDGRLVKAEKARRRRAFSKGFADARRGAFRPIQVKRGHTSLIKDQVVNEFYMQGFELGLSVHGPIADQETLDKEEFAYQAYLDGQEEEFERFKDVERAHMEKESYQEAKKRFYRLLEKQNLIDAGIHTLAVAAGLSIHQARACWRVACRKGIARPGSLGNEGGQVEHWDMLHDYEKEVIEL